MMVARLAATTAGHNGHVAAELPTGIRQNHFSSFSGNESASGIFPTTVPSEYQQRIAAALLATVNNVGKRQSFHPAAESDNEPPSDHHYQRRQQVFL
jgi:hypothetical protein